MFHPRKILALHVAFAFFFLQTHAQTCSLNTVKCGSANGYVNLWENCGVTEILGHSIAIGNATSTSVEIKGHEYTPVVFREFQSNVTVFVGGSDPYQVDAKFWKFRDGQGTDTPFISGVEDNSFSVVLDGLYHVVWEAVSTSISQTERIFEGFVVINNAPTSDFDNRNRFGGYVTHAGGGSYGVNRWIQMQGQFIKRLNAGDLLKLRFGSKTGGSADVCNGSLGAVCKFYIRLISF